MQEGREIFLVWSGPNFVIFIPSFLRFFRKFPKCKIRKKIINEGQCMGIMCTFPAIYLLRVLFGDFIEIIIIIMCTDDGITSQGYFSTYSLAVFSHKSLNFSWSIGYVELITSKMMLKFPSSSKLKPVKSKVF